MDVAAAGDRCRHGVRIDPPAALAPSARVPRLRCHCWQPLRLGSAALTSLPGSTICRRGSMIRAPLSPITARLSRGETRSVCKRASLGGSVGALPVPAGFACNRLPRPPRAKLEAEARSDEDGVPNNLRDTEATVRLCRACVLVNRFQRATGNDDNRGRPFPR